MPLLIIAGITAVAGAGLSYAQSSSRNRAIRRQQEANNRNAQDELDFQRRATELNRERNIREAERIQGLIAASAAERGIGSYGSIEAISRTAAIDSNLNETAIGLDAYGSARRTLAGLASSQASLASQGSNAFLSGLTGGLQGFQLGLSVGGSLDAAGFLGGEEFVGPDGVLNLATGDTKTVTSLTPVRGFY